MKLWKDKIKNIEPYIPGEQPEGVNIVKLNTNECPYPPSPNVEKVLKEYNYEKLRLYPSFVCKELKNELMKIYDVNENEIFLGNGSDEVLALCFDAFFNSDKPILFPDVTYSFYDVWCSLYDIKYERVPLDENFEIKKEDYYKENGGVVIANPNAPTGMYMPLSELEDIIVHNQDVIVIVDEAYIDFGGTSSLELIKKYDNVVVVQTFSKSRALAGIRVGYAMTTVELADVLEAVKNSFNSYTLNSLSQIVAAEALRDDNYFEQCINRIIYTRENTINELKKLGFETLPSKANFIFTTNNKIEAKDLFEYLGRKNIIVRYFNKPRINQYLRITIGTDEEMKVLISGIKEYMNEVK